MICNNNLDDLKGSATSLEPLELNYSIRDDLMNKVCREFLKFQEDVFKNAVRQITGREATLSDAKDLAKIYYPGEFMNYDLAYKGIVIGMVRFELGPLNYTVTFIPRIPNEPQNKAC